MIPSFVLKGKLDYQWNSTVSQDAPRYFLRSMKRVLIPLAHHPCFAVILLRPPVTILHLFPTQKLEHTL